MIVLCKPVGRGRPPSPQAGAVGMGEVARLRKQSSSTPLAIALSFISLTGLGKADTLKPADSDWLSRRRAIAGSRCACQQCRAEGGLRAMVTLKLVLLGSEKAALEGSMGDLFIHLSASSELKAQRAVRGVIQQALKRAQRALQELVVPRFDGTCRDLDSAASLVAIGILHGYRPVSLSYHSPCQGDIEPCHRVIWFSPRSFSSERERADYVKRQLLLVLGYLRGTLTSAE